MRCALGARPMGNAGQIHRIGSVYPFSTTRQIVEHIRRKFSQFTWPPHASAENEVLFLQCVISQTRNARCLRRLGWVRRMAMCDCVDDVEVRHISV